MRKLTFIALLLSAGLTLLAANDVPPVDQIITPETFGCVGDGVTDDTEALQKAFDLVAAGELDTAGLVEAYRRLTDKDALGDQFFYDKAVDAAISKLEEARNHQFANPDGFREAADHFVTVLARRIERKLISTGNNKLFFNHIRNNGRKSSGSKLSRVFRAYVQEQLRPADMFRRFSGYNKRRSPDVYDFADRIEQADLAMKEFSGTAREYIQNLIKNRKEADAFFTGKSKIDAIPFIGELSENVALDLYLALSDPEAFEHVLRHGFWIRMDENGYYRSKAGDKLGTDDKWKRIEFISAHMRKAAALAQADNPQSEAEHRYRTYEHAVTLAEADVRSIYEYLKKRFTTDSLASKIAEAKKAIMPYLGAAINKTSNITLGYDIANKSDNYWPMQIHSDKDYESSDPLDIRSLGDESIFQMREGPSGALVLNPASERLWRYITAASRFAAFGEIADDIAIMDTPFLQHTNMGYGTLTGALSSLDQYYGQWLRNYRDDLNGRRAEQMSSFNAFVGNMRKNLAASKLLGNFAVMVKQAASGAMYGSEIPLRYVLPRLFGFAHSKSYFENSKTVQELQKSSKVLSQRGAGYNLPEVSEFTDEQNSTVTRILHRYFPKIITRGITMMDYKTVANGVLMVEDWVKSERPDLKPGSDAYYDEIRKRWELATMRTQPNFLKESRPEYMRSPNEFKRSAAMFRSQPTQDFNQIVTAFGEYESALRDKSATKAEVEAAKTRAKNAVASKIIGTILFASFGLAGELLLHKRKRFTDDDDKFSWDKFLARFGIKAAEGLASTIWFGDNLAALIVDSASGLLNQATGGKIDQTREFYGIEDNAFSLVSDAAEAIVTFSRNTTANNFRKMVTSLADMNGVPSQNLYNILNAAIMWPATATGHNLNNYDDAIQAAEAYMRLSPSEKAKHTVDRAVWLANQNRTHEANILLSTLDGVEYGDSMKNAITKAYANDKIDFDTALRFLHYANVTGQKAETLLGNAKTNELYNGIKDKFESNLDPNFPLAQLDFFMSKQAKKDARDEVEDYLIDQKKREIASEAGEPYTSRFDKAAQLEDGLEYVAFKEAYNAALTDVDVQSYSKTPTGPVTRQNKFYGVKTDALDRLFAPGGAYSNLSDEAKELLDSSLPNADKQYEAAQHYIVMSDWYAVYDMHRQIDEDENLTASQKVEKFKTWLSHTAFTADQKAVLTEQFGYMNVFKADSERYDKMVAAGLSPDSAMYYSDLKRDNDESTSEAYTLNFVSSGSGTLREKEIALSIFHPGAYERYKKAKACGFSLASWARFVSAAKTAHVRRTGSDGGQLSKKDIEAACKQLGLSGYVDTIYQIFHGK